MSSRRSQRPRAGRSNCFEMGSAFAYGIMRAGQGATARKDGMAYWMVGLELAVAAIIGLAIYLATRK